MSQKADFHVHTTYSDGTLTPQEVVEEARNKGLAAIAITDHDITDGIEPALKYGAKIGIEVIPGIELSCEYNSTEIHILGYYINWENTWFQGKLKVFQKARERRAFSILNKLRALGIDIDEQMVFSMSDMGSISRIHFARCLVEMGVVKNIMEAFRKYLGEGKPAFVRKLRITPEEALSMVHRVAGVPVIAHPVFGGGHKNFISKLKRLGLCGMEVYHPHHSPNHVNRLLAIAKDLNLAVTGGTDSHGVRDDENPIGTLTVDYSLVTKLKQAKNQCDIRNRLILAD